MVHYIPTFPKPNNNSLCKTCHGHKTILKITGINCPKCKGKGFVSDDRIREPLRQVYKCRANNCYGGKIGKRVTCPTCRGSG